MIRVLALLAVLAPLPAQADATIGGKTVDCYCTDSGGGRVDLGQEICLTVGGRAFMALCDMSLNVPTWRDTGRACLSSGLLQRLQRLQPALQPGGVHPKV